MLVGDVMGQEGAQNLVIHAGKELFDVALQHVHPAAGELLRPVHGAMGTLPLAAGIRIINEAALKDRLDDITQGVMDHLVTEGGG